MGQVALPLMLAGGVLSAASSYSAGQSNSAMATIAANQVENNAKLAEISANNAKAVSQVKANETLRQNKLLRSRQIALAAAGGASANEKNVADTISRTAGEGRLAADVDLYEGDLRSMDLMNQAIGLHNKAAVTRYEGKQTRRAANIGSVTSIIGSGASAGSFYGKYGQKAPADTGLNNNFDSALYE